MHVPDFVMEKVLGVAVGKTASLFLSQALPWI